MSSRILLPRIMQVGPGAAREISDVMAQMELNSPFIVTDKFLVDTGVVDMVTASLGKFGIKFGVYSDTPPDPTTETIKAGLEAMKDGDYDCVIGLGGGSPMDTAKALAVLHVHGGEMADYKAPTITNAPGLPIIAIPTTAGTGSEATKFTIITDASSDEKMLCIGRAFLPSAALVDYEVTLTKPYRLTADTGIDSLTHAMEAYVSKKANAFSDAIGLSAMKLIYQNIHNACDQPTNRKAREAMMTGSMMAGMAFSNASVALVHGMSRPIGANFGVPHGLSNAMLLPMVTRFSVVEAMDRYADCARAMEVAEKRDSDVIAVEKLLVSLEQLNVDLKVPSPREYGLDEKRFFEMIPTMAVQALGSGSPANNPRVPTADEISDMYREVFG